MVGNELRVVEPLIRHGACFALTEPILDTSVTIRVTVGGTNGIFHQIEADAAVKLVRMGVAGVTRILAIVGSLGLHNQGGGQVNILFSCPEGALGLLTVASCDLD